MQDINSNWKKKTTLRVAVAGLGLGAGLSLGAAQALSVRTNSAQASSAQTSSARVSPARVGPVLISYRTYHYTCTAGQRVSVAYVNYGQSGPRFAVVNYLGRQYGLAEAISASGARYASLYGPTTANGLGSGLEWWEAQGEGSLNAFVGSDTSKTRVLLSKCRPNR